MKRPVVDYREFRLSRINEERFSHLKLLAGWIGYFIMYFITERFIPAENCHVVHCALDDLIPFNEFFVIPYVLWYLLIIGSLLYFGLYDVDSFKKLMKYIIVTQIAAMAIYIIFPNRQDLRPEVFPRDNFLTDCVALLYSFDTNTNVCPSLHVAYSLGIASTWLKSPEPKKLCKALITAFCLLVCASTAIIKQHSVVDAFAAIPICMLAELIAFGKIGWTRKLYRRNSETKEK